MTSYACLFEAKSIQEYILRSGRLRHVVGASELLDALTAGSDGAQGSLLDDVLVALGCDRDQHLRLSRAAGGAVYLFTDDKHRRDAFRDLWSLAVRQYAPGLEFALATGQGASDYAAYQQAQAALGAARNRQPPLLPAGGPVTRYAPRTGEPAFSKDRTLGLQDLTTHRFGLKEFWRREGGLTARFADLPVDAWPRNLDYQPEDPDRAALFPFLPDNRYLALLHADGNGLGQLLIKMQEWVQQQPQDFVKLFWAFSTAIARATRAAAQSATTEVLLPARRPAHGDDPLSGLIPARPIVLGGDDLTILLRADVALPFARAFLTAFETETAKALAPVRAAYPSAKEVLPERLTAGGGIAFVKSNHPFHLAHALAEALAKRAKDDAKAVTPKDQRIPPTLAFHRVTTACHGSYQDILADEMTTGHTGQTIQTTLVTYALEGQTDLPALADLETLATLLRADGMARGPARQILTLLGQDHDEATRRYQRWREVMGQRAASQTQAFDARLGELCRPWGGLAADLPVSAGPLPTDKDAPPVTPLGDVIALLAVTQGADEDTDTNPTGET